MVMNTRSKNSRRIGTTQDDVGTWNDSHAQIANPKLMYNEFVQIHANLCLHNKSASTCAEISIIF
jgi:hypothetical protein